MASSPEMASRLYPKAREAVVVCRTPRRFKLASNIAAVPWQEIPKLAHSLM